MAGFMPFQEKRR